jgi:glutaredoxin
MYTIYSKPNCPQCDQAKLLLDTKGEEYNVIHLDVGQPKQNNLKYISREDLLKKIPTARMMPQIIKQHLDAEHYVGSYQELKKIMSGT